MEWNSIVAAFINTFLVLLVVQVIKHFIPIINASVPWLLPIIAAVIGPLVTLIQNWLFSLLGVPIDLSPIIGVFTGASAVAAFQVGRQFRKAGGK